MVLRAVFSFRTLSQVDTVERESGVAPSTRASERP